MRSLLLKSLTALFTFAGIAAHVPAQISFSHNFASEQIPTSLELGYGSIYTTSGERLSFTGSIGGGRTYFNTVADGYYDLNFVADIQFQIGSDIFFAGLGQPSSYFGGTDIGLDDAAGPVIGVRLHPLSLGSGTIGTIDHKVGSSAVTGVVETGVNMVSQINMLRFNWNGSNHTGYFELDVDYGGAFAADYTTSIFDGADNGFDASDTFLYFGGAGDTRVYSIDVAASAVPEPSTYAAIAGFVLLGWTLWRRRLAPRYAARVVATISALPTEPVFHAKRTLPMTSSPCFGDVSLARFARRSWAIALMVSASWFTLPAHAQITIRFEQSGEDVIASYSGNWAASGQQVVSYQYAEIGPNYFQAIGHNGAFSHGALFVGVSGFAPWSSVQANAATGDAFGFSGGLLVWGPSNFTPSTHISGSLFFADKSLSDLGMTAGDFGTLTGTAGTVNWSASLAAVPEPSTYAALAGAAMLGFACWRRRRATAETRRCEPAS